MDPMAKFRRKWARHPESYTSEEKRHILSKVVEIMIRVTFSTHFYKWENKIYKQCKGGPIGLRATGLCAKLIMDDWLEKFRDKLEANGRGFSFNQVCRQSLNLL